MKVLHFPRFATRNRVFCRVLTMGIAGLVTLGTACVSPPAHATPVKTSLNFTSSNQSMWKPGTAQQLNVNQFLGTSWTDKSASLNLLTGGVTTTQNPLWDGWYACDQAFGIFGGCGSAPAKYITVDTRTGVKATVSTSGKIGFNFGMTADAGAIDSQVDYDAAIDVPTNVQAGDLVNFNTSGTSLTAGSGLQSTFPGVKASLAAVMQASADFSGEACFIPFGCTSGQSSTGQLGGTQELVSIDTHGSGGSSGGTVSLLGGAATVDPFPIQLSVPAPGGAVLPAGIKVGASIATISIDLPHPNVTGSLNGAGTAIAGSNEGDFLNVDVDLDTLLSLALTDGATGALFGGKLSFGKSPLAISLAYNLINAELGPQLWLKQKFDLTPSLYVDLQFSQPTSVTGYGTVTSLAGLDWSHLPSMAFDPGTTTVTPTFYLGTMVNGTLVKNTAELLNQLLFDVRGHIEVDLLDATLKFPPLGINKEVGVGTLVDEPFGHLDTPDLYDTTFALGGFSPLAGTPFTITTLGSGQATGGGSGSGTGTGGGSEGGIGPVFVPEPGALSLFGLGLLGLGLAFRQRQKGRN